MAECTAWKAGRQQQPPLPPSDQLKALAGKRSVDDFCDRVLGDQRDKDETDKEKADREKDERDDQERRDREQHDGGGDKSSGGDKGERRRQGQRRRQGERPGPGWARRGWGRRLTARVAAPILAVSAPPEGLRAR